MGYVRRQLDDLVNLDEPAWPLVQQWVSDARRSVEVLEPSELAGECLVSVQITTRSPLGAVMLRTGGILVDHGWLRILGSGHPRLARALPRWNPKVTAFGTLRPIHSNGRTLKSGMRIFFNGVYRATLKNSMNCIVGMDGPTRLPFQMEAMPLPSIHRYQSTFRP